jgi:membrane-associated phospholipid phosphatase
MSGIEILQVIQAMQSPFLDSLFSLVTNLHHETVYVLLLPLLFWFYHKGFARYLLSVFMLGYLANQFLKYAFDTARPTADQVRVLHSDSVKDAAFPSGHAQNPLMFWGALALQFRSRWFTTLAVVLIFSIGFSRLYLGLHWPLDILGGWVIGGLMLWGFTQSRWFWMGERLGFGHRLLWAFVIPLGALASTLVIDGPIPKEVWVSVGAYLGLWVGAVLEEQWVNFDPRRGGVGVQVLKAVIGLGLVLLAKDGLKLVVPDTALGTLFRYGTVGLTASLIAPWLFQRFLLSPPIGRTVSR